MATVTQSRLSRRLGEAEALGRQAEQWRLDHAEAVQVLDLEDLIADAVRLVDDVNTLARQLYARMSSNALEEPFQVGNALRELFEVVAWVCRTCAARAAVAEGQGYAVPGLINLKGASIRLDALASWLARAWPRAEELFDPAEMELSAREAEADDLATHREVWQRLRSDP